MGQSKLSFRAPSQPSGPTVWTVGQVVRGANRALEQRFGLLWIEGELTGLKLAASGHAYFTLVDDDAALPVAMWRTSVERLRFRLVDGQVLRVQGRLGIFAKQGKFQFYAEHAEPAGLGAMMLELEQRKQRLAADGLLAAERKRELPPWPRAIGVVTSAHGAAIHDILEVARRRCPSHVILSPAVVQGPDAPRSLVRALQRVQRWPGVGVVIIGRGGGSAEDLWAFNDERLARAVAACPVPVVSAVGHEVDVTICDLVADLRAATPSHAAELVVPDLHAVLQRLDALSRRLARALERSTLDERARLEAGRARLHGLGLRLHQAHRERLGGLVRRLQAHHPQRRVARDRRRLEGLVARLRAAGRELAPSARMRLATLDRRLVTIGGALPRTARVRLARAAGALQALSPLGVLERGYAVATDASGRALCDARRVQEGDEIALRLHRGRLRARVFEREDDP
ncbi:exodeoxyribonuclease VII large subunit [Paraliomyxa miuraensis]|uniref:exodeoxyribonuclease VII large subunit n=1 Tax=Paraliomyxa miuraensis TaxID=376150 RepID=UPI002257327B|nr:exodeoxyribonuclease VII large subunit [Paraliomyxa miuraensis]MCX4242126.1 exodeoxyribonuclease VII large subunit [Paraliomyxa miuraensis]